MEKIKMMTKAEKILRHLEANPQGLKLGEISKFIYELNYPGKSGERRVAKVWRKDRLVETSKPVYAGYYGTNLLGGGMYGPAGLLDLFCVKTADRRYVLTEKIKAPFYGKKRKTRTLELNNAHREREWKLREAMAPKCPNCAKSHVYNPDKFLSPDGTACMVSWGVKYSTDCKKRVWTGDNRLTSLSQDDLNSFHTNTIEPAVKSLPVPARFDVGDKLRTAYVNAHVKGA